jgi:hypothetical protein
MNITKNGITNPPAIVPYSKGADAFYHGIRYESMDDHAYTGFVRELYDHIFCINEIKTILPWLGWMFVAPVKEKLKPLTGGFPFVFVHGGQGSGKSSTASIFMRLCGYKDPDPKSSETRHFPLLKALSATNGVPVFMDEFKESDMKDDAVDILLRMLRKSYSGEVESKGRADQTVEDYRILAPVTVMGEWNITQPALKERMLVSRFSDAIKKDEGMKKAFGAVKSLPLEAFMPRYNENLLGQEIESMFARSQRLVSRHFGSMMIAPRISTNLSIMVLGIWLLKRFGRQYGARIPSIDLSALLDDQLEEITGSKTGFVKSAVDQLVEELSVLAQNGQLGRDTDYLHTSIDLKNKGTLDVVAIWFSKIFPGFKEHARRTNYEGDLLDKESYYRLFEECEYVVAKNWNVRFPDKQRRCLVIDYERAKAAGLDLDGFR